MRPVRWVALATAVVAGAAAFQPAPLWADDAPAAPATATPATPAPAVPAPAVPAPATPAPATPAAPAAAAPPAPAAAPPAAATPAAAVPAASGPAAAAPAAAAPAAAAPVAAMADDPVVARRGDLTLTLSAVRELVRMSDPEQRHVLESNPDALLQAVRDRLLKLSIVKQAEDRGWDKRADIAYRLQLTRDDVIVGSWLAAQIPDDPHFPTDAQVQTAYDVNKPKLILPRRYRLAQIFLLVPPGSTKQTEDDDQRKLADVRQQLVKQHGDFATLAKRVSDDKISAAAGGDLGWVRDDQMVGVIRTAVQGLNEGGISPPVRGPNGWHLVKLVAVKPPQQATLAEARETLVRALRQERQGDLQRSFIGNLLQQQPIEVNEVELNKLSAK